MAEQAQYLHVFITSEYEEKESGDTKTNFMKVGAAFPNSKGGFGIQIEEGISVTGKLVALPPRDNDNRNSEK